MFNGITLSVSSGGGGVVASPTVPDSFGPGWSRIPWGTVNTTGSSTTGSGSFTSALSAVIGGLTYTVHLTTTYTYPSDYFTQSYTVDIPAGNTGTVKLFTPYDTYLGGSDAGPGYFKAGPPPEVGVAGTDAVEAIRYVSGPAWAGYASENFNNIVFGGNGYGPSFGTNYTNVINADPATDNGIGVNWSLGSTPGSTPPMTYLFMFATGGTPDSPTNPTATPGPGNGEITVSWTPPSSGPAPTGYAVTGVPGGGCTAVAPATSCVVTGLTPGQEYTFTVTGTNAKGSGFPSAASAAVKPGTGASQAQTPANGCVTAPKTLPHKGVKKLMKANCVTNAGQKVKVQVTCGPLYRGDIRYCRVYRAANGATMIRTYGNHAAVKVRWSAAAKTGYAAYRLTRNYTI